MIIIDENKLTFGTIAKIGDEYGMTYNYEDYEVETYEAYIRSIVDRFEFNVEDFKDMIMKIVGENLKVELKLKNE